MSEHEKELQIGRVVEEVARLQGELNHVNEKLGRAFTAYSYLAQQNAWSQLRVHNDQLLIPQPPRQPLPQFDGILGYHEMVNVVKEKQRLSEELQTAKQRLRELAPNLLLQGF